MSDIENAAEEAGIAWRTVERAKKDLRINGEKTGFASNGEWSWNLRPPNYSPIDPLNNGGLNEDTTPEPFCAKAVNDNLAVLGHNKDGSHSTLRPSNCMDTDIVDLDAVLED